MRRVPTALRSSGRAFALAGRSILAFILGAGVVATIVLALPSVTDHRTMTVLTGSMRPTLDPGTVVINEVIRPTDARIGDVVTFREPLSGRLVTHRLRDVRVVGMTAQMVTRGDANDTSERWTIPLDGEIGRVVVAVPQLGHVQALAGNRLGHLLLMVSILGLGVWMLVDVWRRPAGARRTPALVRLRRIGRWRPR